MMDLLRRVFGKAEETRASSSAGYTAAIMAARESYIAGRSGLGELTGTVQSCVSLWEHALAQADVLGTDRLDPATLGMIARSLALRGEAVFLIGEEALIPASDWEISTRDGKPRAYRISVSEAGGGYTTTALAPEVLHVRIGVDPVAPWTGTAPLSRAALSAGLLHAIETALAEVYQSAPIGSQVVPMPELGEDAINRIERGFRGRRGSTLLRESVHVGAAGAAAPSSDWRPADLTPDLEKAVLAQSLDRARASIASAFGVLPGLFEPATTGPLVREAQRHLAQYQIQPIANLIAAEASDKLGGEIRLDVMRPLQAYDAGGRARALSATVAALSQAKEAGLSDEALAAALRLVDWRTE